VNWITYGLFVTSLPQLLEFLPAKRAQAAQDWISFNVGPSATFRLVIVGIIFAAFLAWKNKDDELAQRRIGPKAISRLANLLTEAGNLFDKGQHAASSEDIRAWEIAFADWFTRTSEMITINISKAEATLFSEPAGGPLLNHYVGHREHNQRLNVLLGYRDNLRRIIERYSDR
jgi:hypothetical protein